MWSASRADTATTPATEATGPAERSPGEGKLRGTKYGISAAAFPTLDIANLTLDTAKAIYRANYWNKIAGDEMPGPIAEAVFDCAVNQGTEAAAEMLQEALGVDADGIIRPSRRSRPRRHAATT